MKRGIKIPAMGIDASIQSHQNFSFNHIKDQWCLTDEQYECYGRCYRNQVKNKNGSIGYKPELYVGDGEYTDLLLDDKLHLQSFYGVGDTIAKEGPKAVAQVHLIFIANISKLEPNVVHRADEEVRLKIWDILTNKVQGWGFRVTELVTDVNRVFAEYNSDIVRNGMYAKDMQPFHVFRVNMELTYSPKLNC